MSKLISIRARSSMNMEGKGNQGKAAFGSPKLYSIIKGKLHNLERYTDEGKSHDRYI